MCLKVVMFKDREVGMFRSGINGKGNGYGRKRAFRMEICRLRIFFFVRCKHE